MDGLFYRLKHYPAFHAYLDDKLVGFVNTKRFAPDILEVTNMCVAKDFQNQGIGFQLLKELEQCCEETQWRALILVNSDLYENKNNERTAQDFYEKNGYELSFRTKNTLCFYKVL